MAGSIEQPNRGLISGRDFTFRPLARSDFPILFSWLHNPAVQEWWDDPPATIDEIEGKHVPRIDGSELVYGYIAEHLGVPMGYLQWYRLGTEPEHPAVGLVPEDAAAIDLFIGEDAYRRRGYGSVMIGAFLRNVVFNEPDVGSCAIDPCVGNRVAIAAYRKTGFRDIGIAANPHENRDSQIMLIDRGNLSDSLVQSPTVNTERPPGSFTHSVSQTNPQAPNTDQDQE